jgi:hypothetical protein
MPIDSRFKKLKFLVSPFVDLIITFSPSVDSGGLLDKDFDIKSSFGVTKVQVESDNVYKTGL